MERTMVEWFILFQIKSVIIYKTVWSLNTLNRRKCNEQNVNYWSLSAADLLLSVKTLQLRIIHLISSVTSFTSVQFDVDYRGINNYSIRSICKLLIEHHKLHFSFKSTYLIWYISLRIAILGSAEGGLSEASLSQEDLFISAARNPW